MTDTFTASNGITVFVRDGGTVQFQHGTRAESCGILQVMPHSEWWQTLREFFQHERDEALGRWRWPEKPEWVVYAKRTGFVAHNGADLLVINELYGASMEYSRALDDGTEYVEEDEKAALAARAYFEAHPERKPWHDAQPGEVWVINIGDDADAANWQGVVVSNGSRFLYRDGGSVAVNQDFIIDGRRIWPEDAS